MANRFAVVFVALFVAFWTTAALALNGKHNHHHRQVSTVGNPPHVSSLELCGYYNHDKACPEGCYGTTPVNDDYDDDGGNVTCLVTAPGFFSETNETNSLPCMSGYFQPNYKSSECFPCPVGTYAPNLSATECLPCPPNHFQPLEGQASCLPCDPTSNEILALFPNATTVLDCVAPKDASSSVVEPRSKTSKTTKESPGAAKTPSPSSLPPTIASPSTAPTSMHILKRGNAGLTNQDASAEKPLSGGVVFAAASLAVLFVVSSITVILTRRPGAKVHPENNDPNHDRLTENNLFNAFRSNRGEELPRPPPPPQPPFEAGGFEDVALDGDDNGNGFLSPPPPNHLVPQPPQGPAVVTPWYPGEDEELGYNSEETKEPEASFDGILAYEGGARIIHALPTEDVAIVKNLTIESPLREPRRNGGDQDSGEEGYSNYIDQMSPMSGSSQV